MRITAIDTYIAGNPWKNWVFTKVSTDEGIHGVGEGTLNGFGKTVEAAIHELKPLAIGMDPFQVETISQRLVRDVYSEGAQIHMCAVAAIEIALWDIIWRRQMGWQTTGGKARKSGVRRVWVGVTVWNGGTAVAWTALAGWRVTQYGTAFIPLLVMGVLACAITGMALTSRRNHARVVGGRD